MQVLFKNLNLPNQKIFLNFYINQRNISKKIFFESPRKKMENLNDLKILLSFVPSFKDKSVLQLGSDPFYTELFSQEDVSPKLLTVVDSDQVLLQKNKDANLSRGKNLEFIHSELKNLSLSDQKSV